MSFLLVVDLVSLVSRLSDVFLDVLVSSCFVSVLELDDLPVFDFSSRFFINFSSSFETFTGVSIFFGFSTYLDFLDGCSGSMLFVLVGKSPSLNSDQCKCGPVEAPVEPTAPIKSPFFTFVPDLTFIALRCAYAVFHPLGCTITTQFP